MTNLDKPAPEKVTLKAKISELITKIDVYLDAYPEPKCEIQSIENQNIKK